MVCLSTVQAAFGIQSLGKEAQTIVIPPERFDQIARPAPEDNDVTKEEVNHRFLFLGDSRHSIESPAHVRHPSREPVASALPTGRGRAFGIDSSRNWTVTPILKKFLSAARLCELISMRPVRNKNGHHGLGRSLDGLSTKVHAVVEGLD